jgi:hypothetical protein
MSVEETYNDIMNLLLFQNNNILLIEKFIHILYNVLNRSSGKKNCIEVIGRPSSYKTTFFNFVCCALLTKGDIHRINRHCQFPFQVYVQNEWFYKMMLVSSLVNWKQC